MIRALCALTIFFAIFSRYSIALEKAHQVGPDDKKNVLHSYVPNIFVAFGIVIHEI